MLSMFLNKTDQIKTVLTLNECCIRKKKSPSILDIFFDKQVYPNSLKLILKSWSISA
jgi:NAD kinase